MRVLWRTLRARPADRGPRAAEDARRRSLRRQLSDRVWGLHRAQRCDAPRGVSPRRRGRARAFLPTRHLARMAEDPADAAGGCGPALAAACQSMKDRLLHHAAIAQMLHDDALEERRRDAGI